VVRVERVGEHAAELERRDVFLQFGCFLADLLQGRVISIRLGQLEQLGGVGQAAADAGQRADERLEGLLFLAEVLRALRVLPELRVFQLAVQRREAVLLRLEVKDTSSARPTAPAGRRGWRRSG
jgi:hypothetical protein